MSIVGESIVWAVSSAILLLFVLVLLSHFLDRGKRMSYRGKKTIIAAVAITAILAIVIISIRMADRDEIDLDKWKWERIEQIEDCVEAFLLGEDIWLSDDKLRSIAIDIYERDDYEYDKRTGYTIDESYLNTLLVILEEE